MDRKRNFQFEFYPDSLPLEDAENFLQGYFQKYVISPLHDMDIKDDGQYKKPHFHVVGCLKNACSPDNVRSILKDNKFVCNPDEKIVVFDMCKMVRYLAHADNNDKASYDFRACRGNLDFEKYFDDSDISSDSCFYDIVMYIRDNKLTDPYELFEVFGDGKFLHELRISFSKFISLCNLNEKDISYQIFKANEILVNLQVEIAEKEKLINYLNDFHELPIDNPFDS